MPLIETMSDAQVAAFFLQIYRGSKTGRFSLTYNLDLRIHIQMKKPDRIRYLLELAGSKKSWPEVYFNPLLSPEEINIMLDTYNREYYAMLNTLETLLSSSSCKIHHEITTEEKQTVDTVLDKDGQIHHTSISNEIDSCDIISDSYSRCYENICISETIQTGKVIKLSEKEFPKVLYIEQAVDGSDGTEKRCFDSLELIGKLAKLPEKDPAIQDLSETAIEELTKAHGTEIKMYKHHLDILRKNGW